MSKHPDAIHGLDRCLTIPKLSRESGFGVRFLRSEVNAGRLEAIRVSPRGWPRVRWRSWLDYLERHRASVPSAPLERELVRRVVSERLAREGDA